MLMRAKSIFAAMMVSLFGLLLASCAKAGEAEQHEFAEALVALFEDACFRSMGDLDKVSDLAADNGWKAVDPKSLPAKDELLVRQGSQPVWQSSVRNLAWSTAVAGREVIVSVKVAKRFGHPSCEVMSFGKKAEAAEVATMVRKAILGFDGGNRLSLRSNPPPYPFPGRDVAAFAMERSKGTIFYAVINEGNRVLHHITQFGEIKL
jgi:hypothetical protein